MATQDSLGIGQWKCGLGALAREKYKPISARQFFLAKTKMTKTKEINFISLLELKKIKIESIKYYY